MELIREKYNDYEPTTKGYSNLS